MPTLVPRLFVSHRFRQVMAVAAGTMGVSSGVVAQAVAPAASATSPAKEDEPIQLAAFEVVMTQDKG